MNQLSSPQNFLDNKDEFLIENEKQICKEKEIVTKQESKSLPMKVEEAEQFISDFSFTKEEYVEGDASRISHPYQGTSLIPDLEKYLNPDGLNITGIHSKRYEFEEGKFVNVLTRGCGSCFFYSAQLIQHPIYTQYMKRSLHYSLNHHQFDQQSINEGDQLYEFRQFADLNEQEAMNSTILNNYLDNSNISNIIQTMDNMPIKQALQEYKARILNGWIEFKDVKQIINSLDKRYRIYAIELQDDEIDEVLNIIKFTQEEFHAIDRPMEGDNICKEQVDIRVLYEYCHFSRLLTIDEWEFICSVAQKRGNVSIHNIQLDGILEEQIKAGK